MDQPQQPDWMQLVSFFIGLAPSIIQLINSVQRDFFGSPAPVRGLQKLAYVQSMIEPAAAAVGMPGMTTALNSYVMGLATAHVNNQRALGNPLFAKSTA